MSRLRSSYSVRMRRIAISQPNATGDAVNVTEKAIKDAKCDAWRWEAFKEPKTERTNAIDRMRQAQGDAEMWGLGGLFKQ